MFQKRGLNFPRITIYFGKVFILKNRASADFLGFLLFFGSLKFLLKNFWKKIQFVLVYSTQSNYLCQQKVIRILQE